MTIVFDAQKSIENHRKHGLALSDFAGFDDVPRVIEDRRRDYGERRYQAFGYIGGLGYMIVYTLRGTTIRLISFRRARMKEIAG